MPDSVARTGNLDIDPWKVRGRQVERCGGCAGRIRAGARRGQSASGGAGRPALLCVRRRATDDADAGRWRVGAMGALNPWVAAGRDINDPLLLQQRGSLFASQGAPWDAVAGVRQLLRVCPLGPSACGNGSRYGRFEMARTARSTSVAPTMEPMRPLGRMAKPSPKIRLPSRPPINEPAIPIARTWAQLIFSPRPTRR